MIIFYSGSGSGKDNPERVLEGASIMLTYFNNQKKPEKRFRLMYKKIRQWINKTKDTE